VDLRRKDVCACLNVTADSAFAKAIFYLFACARFCIFALCRQSAIPLNNSLTHRCVQFCLINRYSIKVFSFARAISYATTIRCHKYRTSKYGRTYLGRVVLMCNVGPVDCFDFAMPSCPCEKSPFATTLFIARVGCFVDGYCTGSFYLTVTVTVHSCFRYDSAYWSVLIVMSFAVCNSLNVLRGVHFVT